MVVLFLLCVTVNVLILNGLNLLEGLVMGDAVVAILTPAIVYSLPIQKTLGMSMDQIEETLVKKSGLLGLTEVISDCCYAEDNYDVDEFKLETKRAF